MNTQTTPSFNPLTQRSKAAPKNIKKEPKNNGLIQGRTGVSADSHPQARKYPRSLSAVGPKSEVESGVLPLDHRTFGIKELPLELMHIVAPDAWKCLEP